MNLETYPQSVDQRSETTELPFQVGMPAGDVNRDGMVNGYFMR